MNAMKTITAAVALSASIAAPAFAQDAYQSYADAPYRHAPQYYPRNSEVRCALWVLTKETTIWTKI